MGKTFAEKALARAAGLAEVVPGQVVDAQPDVALSHDNTAAILRIFRQLGVSRVRFPERLAITLDHAAPAPTTQHAQNHAEVRRFVSDQGIRHFFEVGRGICHQVLSEEALALPGQTVLGADSHTPHFGWLGAFGAGVGRSEMAAIWATGELWLRVPESIQIVVEGRLDGWATAKDLALAIIGCLGADGGLYASVEISGPAIEALSLESRMVLPNMMAEFGVKNAYLTPDQAVFAWLAARRMRSEIGDQRSEIRDQRSEIGDQASGRRVMGGLESSASNHRSPVSGLRPAVSDLQSQLAATALYPDPDAVYAARHVFDADAIEPSVACPDTVDNVAPVSAVAGTRVQQAFLGTCTNGRLEDLAQAAAILAGRRVAAGTRLLVIPASSEVYRDALRAGYIETFIEAGAVIGPPGCGPCMGNHLGILAPGEVCISSANRNFKGRMGTADSQIYLASPAVVAASAVAGEIVHPGEVVG
ncbi:aconitase family protein [Candidatus Amarolinea aalborgensis]|uniref:aconitase family protein n=1 Tax=Candidatus Amarolinea aalborgensis TaxID=2249329 RepID=UPI003BF993E6